MTFINLKFKSLNLKILEVYIHFVKLLLFSLNIKFSIFFLPKKLKKITLLKSPHVYKKAREQFEQKVYKVFVVAQVSSNNHFNFFFKALLINKPKMVSLKIKNQ